MAYLLIGKRSVGLNIPRNLWFDNRCANFVEQQQFADR
jgi:hypothetical protein